MWRGLWQPAGPGWYAAWGSGERGDGERFHRHTVTQTFTVVSGRLVVRVGDHLHYLDGPGASLYAGSLEPHGLVILEPATYVSVFFEPDGPIDLPRIKREQVPSITAKEAAARRALLDQGRVMECFGELTR